MREFVLTILSRQRRHRPMVIRYMPKSHVPLPFIEFNNCIARVW